MRVARRRRSLQPSSALVGLLALVALVGAAERIGLAAEVRVARSDEGATITVGDQPFAIYRTRSGAKPVLWPIFGPGQVAMTRSYPLDTSKTDEAHDHPHQRSFWFTYGEVNGIDFWSEPAAYKDGTLPPGKLFGVTEHRGFQKLESAGGVATIVTTDDWLGPDGKKVLEDERRLVFAASDDARTIDFDITLKATAGPVDFGDTKEGAFGLRVADCLAVKKKLGGEIKNDRGLANYEAWAQPASWVDYHGKIDGQPMGIAIMNHPDSFGYPTRWHVRDYGLFAANPFGSQGFDLKPKGGHHMAPGDTLRLCYRVLLHRGDEQSGGVAAAFQSYAGEKRP